MDFKINKIQTKLSISFILISIIIQIISLFFFYHISTNKLNNELKHRLLDIVNISSKSIDGNIHSRLTMPSDENNENYNLIKEQLQEIQSVSKDIYYIYTFRVDKNGNMRFIVDADDNPETIAHLGDIYEEASNFLKTNIDEIEEGIIEEEIADRWGTFLSGYAPIFNTDGSVDAYIGIDINAEQIKKYNQTILFAALIIFLLTIPFVLLIGYFVARSFTKPILELTIVSKELAAGHTAKEIKINTNDEIGTLAKSFNKMSFKIQDFIKNLEHKVKSKTKHLEEEIKIKTKTQLALQESETELLKMNATKDKFFSIIAHDLRSPFNTLLGFSQMLYESYDLFDTSTHKKNLKIMYQTATSANKLLEELLLWSRSQRNIIEFEPIKETVYNLSSDTIALLNRQAEKKDIKLSNKIPNDIYVYADSNMFSTIIRNLISNAIKFTPHNGEIIIIAKKIKNIKLKEFIEISIIDNGVGISKKKQSELFTITQNISTQGTDKEPGTGLGLILCKEFVDKHKGEIRVESEEGKGSKFIFTIPMNS